MAPAAVAPTNPPVAWYLQLTTPPPGQCTNEAFGRDTGYRLDGFHQCSGAWVIGGDVCPSDLECEAVQILRWVHDKWIDRGFHYGYCAQSMTNSGIPYSIADSFVGPGFCDPPDRRVSPEPPVGSLSRGDGGSRVLVLQQALIAGGLLADSADGQFGPNTEAAVYDLEHLLGLQTDGVADAAVLDALGLAN
jgi:hypothetical protein